MGKFCPLDFETICKCSKVLGLLIILDYRLLNVVYM